MVSHSFCIMSDTVSAISESLIERYNWKSFLMYSSFILKLLIFFWFFIFMLVVYNWCLYALSVCKFHHIQKGGTWFLVMLSEEIQHFFTYLILREKRPSKKGLFNQKDFSLLSSKPWLYLFTVFLSAKSTYHWCHLGRKD